MLERPDSGGTVKRSAKGGGWQFAGCVLQAEPRSAADRRLALLAARPLTAGVRRREKREVRSPNWTVGNGARRCRSAVENRRAEAEDQE